MDRGSFRVMTFAHATDAYPQTAEATAFLPATQVIPLLPSRTRRLLRACEEDMVGSVVEPMLGAPSLEEALTTLHRSQPVTALVNLTFRRLLTYEMLRNPVMLARYLEALDQVGDNLQSLRPILGDQGLQRVQEVCVTVRDAQASLFKAPDHSWVFDRSIRTLMEVELCTTDLDIMLMALSHAATRVSMQAPPPWLGGLVDVLVERSHNYQKIIASLLDRPVATVATTSCPPAPSPSAEIDQFLKSLLQPTRQNAERILQLPEAYAHLQMGLSLLQELAPSAPIEGEVDLHDAEGQIVLIARLAASPDELIAQQENLSRRWRQLVGPRPTRHVLLQVKPLA